MTPSHIQTRIVASDSPQATFALGERLGRAIQSGVIIALHGDLGAGKTTLTQGIAAGLGIRATLTSPTFTFVNEYTFAAQGDPVSPTRPRARLYHIDLYRLPATSQQAQAEAATFGLDEIFDAAEASMDANPPSPGLELTGELTVVIIEWAERIAGSLPPDHLEIELAHHTPDGSPDAREIRLRAGGPVSRSLLAHLNSPTSG